MNTKGYTIIPNKFLDESSLSPQSRYLFCILKRLAGQDESCYPSQKTLARILGVSTRHIRTYLEQLKKANWITSKRTGFNRPNTYFLHLHSRNSSSDQLGTSVPTHNGSTIPTKITYRKGKVKKGMENLKEIMKQTGILSQPLSQTNL